MKLLLTSGGITNESIADAMSELVGKPAEQVKIGMIPTAANVEPGDKSWFVSQNFTDLQKRGYKQIDIVDPSALGVDWQERLKETDVIFVSGGNTFHLLDQFRKTGFDQWIGQNAEHKVYIGISAGSIVVTSSIEVSTIPPADPNLANLTDLTGLNLVGFQLEPHCDEGRFNTMRSYADSGNITLYALDDQSALKVVNDNVEVISEGSWKKFN